MEIAIEGPTGEGDKVVFESRTDARQGAGPD